MSGFSLPFEAHPSDVVLDGSDILFIFFFRICIIIAEPADTAELFGCRETQSEGFGMADMKVAVGLRGETGNHL